jgi:ribosomal protein S18 acetylase RimI-like enzyme
MPIRAAVDEDVPFLREMTALALAASPTFLARIGAAEIAAHEDAYWSTWRDPAFISFDGATLLGAITLKPDGDRWRIGMGVVAHARGRGVGRALIARAVEHARETGTRALCLLVDPSNTSARALYDRTGFIVSGERAGVIEMELVL